jgi:hypothetical protein
MTFKEVLALLEENTNERGLAHWQKKPRRLKSFGIGLTQLRKLAKKGGLKPATVETIKKKILGINI